MSGCSSRIDRAMMSGPLKTWTGMLSATASSSSPPETTQQEKSRAVLRITERPVRISVLDMLRTIASKRLERIARSTGSNGSVEDIGALRGGRWGGGESGGEDVDDD